LSLTYSTVLALAQTLLDDTSTASGITTSQWVTLFNAANRDVWRMLVNVNPSYFQTYGDITFPASTEKITLSGASYLNTTPYKLIQVEATAITGNVTPQNLPRKLMPVTFQERPQFLSDMLVSLSPGSMVPGPYVYTYDEDSTMYVAPLSQTACPMRIHYVPPLAAVTGQSNDVVLAGRAQSFHDAVAHRLAWYASVKRGGTPGVAGQLWLESENLIKNSAPTRNEGEPWRVRKVS
jgi:hypothetical protein